MHPKKLLPKLGGICNVLYMIVNNLKRLRKDKGLSQSDLADLVGTTVSQLGKLERGERRLSDVWLARLSKALECEASDIISDRQVWQDIPITHLLGKGQEVVRLEGPPLGNVKVPSAMGDVMAVCVSGDDAWPRYEEGDVIIISSLQEKPSELLGQECVCQLSGGRTFLKKLERGCAWGTYRLVSHNSPPIEDQEIEAVWSARWVFRGTRRAPRSRSRVC